MVEAGVADAGEDVVGDGAGVEEPVGVGDGVGVAGVGGKVVAVGGEGFEAFKEGAGEGVGGGDGAEAGGATFEAFGGGGVVEFMHSFIGNWKLEAGGRKGGGGTVETVRGGCSERRMPAMRPVAQRA